MSKSNLKVAEAAPPRTPEREALARAIAEHAAAVKEVRRVREAHEHSEEVWLRAVARADAASAALERARAFPESERVAALALGETVAGPTLAEAEDAVAQAANDKDIAVRTGDALRARLARDEAEVTRLKEAITEAAAAVMKSEPAVAALAAEQEQVNRRLGELAHILSFLGRNAASPTNEFGYWPDRASGAVVDPYRAWLAALQSDPDAPLPQG